MKNKKFAKISKKLVSNESDYMASFRENIRIYLNDADITVSELAEMANLSYDSLKTFIYNGTKDCKLSTAISLARALNVSVDELVGAGTLTENEKLNIYTVRNLPDYSKYLIRWFIEHQKKTYDNTPKGNRVLNVMKPICNGHGNLKMSKESKDIDITHLVPELRSKVFFGMKIPCEHYMPFYSPYDVLLICNDRPAMEHEHLVIENDNCLFIVKRKVVNGVAKLYSIRDDIYRMDENDIDKVIGYVADILKVDLEF